MSELPDSFYIFWFFILGALFGSFGNVVIYRLPLEKSIVSPRSACMKCGASIPWYLNIPIASWFILKGRCRSCKEPFSFRYPLVEFITAVLFGLAFATFHWHWMLLEALIFIWGLVVCTFIDIDHMILPDEFTLGGLALGLIGAALNPDRAFLDGLIGFLVGGGFLWFMAWVYYAMTGNDGMGGGDIKLLAWIGAILGYKAIPFVIVVSAVCGSIVGLALAWKQRKGLKTAIPFGPYLALGAVIYLLDGQTLGRAYWDLFLP